MYVSWESKSIHIKDIELILQKALDNIKRFTQKQDSISIEKTKIIVCTRLNPGNGRPAFNIKLQGQQIKEVMKLKILSLIFDHRSLATLILRIQS
jgi:hypothetical protein